MDHHRDTLGTYGWREGRQDQQTTRAQLRANLDELHKTRDRWRALQSEYRELLENVRENMLEANALHIRSKQGTDSAD